jgi:hypothetical protein
MKVFVSKFPKYPTGPTVRRTSGQTLANRHKSQAKFEAKPSEIKKREERNAARASMAKKGLVKKGDGKDVDHIRGTEGGNDSSNLRVLTKSQNRRYNRRSARTKLA